MFLKNSHDFRAVIRRGAFSSAAVLFLLCFVSGQIRAQESLPSAPSATGTISGLVTDPSGAVVLKAQVVLNREGMKDEETATDAEGRFTFGAVAPGTFHLVVTFTGLAPAVIPGVLKPGEVFEVPTVALRIATANVSVQVGLTKTELAQIDVKNAEKQRVLGFIPNYYVTYNHNAPPLTVKQKFSLSLHEQFDPGTIATNGAVAGVEQAKNYFPGYHQGAEGYFKRFGANTADMASDTLLRHGLLAVAFRQDPRYFYKGNGTKTSRALYAISTAFIAKGDNGRWQPAYASIGGNMASGALSNLYYPPGNRKAGAATIELGLERTAGVAAAHLVQEFLFKYVSTGVNNKPDPTIATK